MKWRLILAVLRVAEIITLSRTATTVPVTTTASLKSTTPGTTGTSVKSTTTPAASTKTTTVTQSITTKTLSTTSAGPAAVFILIFAIDQTFTVALSNTNSAEFRRKSEEITNAVEPLYKEKYAKFIRLLIKKFSCGSIITEIEISFSSNSVTVTDIKETLFRGIKDLPFKIDSASINIKQTVGNSMSPVLTGSVYLIWMSLLSLLLSLALHY